MREEERKRKGVISDNAKDGYDGATCNVVSVLYIFQMRLKPCLATSYLLLLSIVSVYIARARARARVDGNLH